MSEKKLNDFFRPTLSKIIIFGLLCLLILYWIIISIPADPNVASQAVGLSRVSAVLIGILLWPTILFSEFLKIENFVIYCLNLVYLYMLACLVNLLWVWLKNMAKPTK